MDSPEQQQPAEPNPSQPPSAGGPRRRGRRGGRGRGRSRRPPVQVAQTMPPAGTPAAGQAPPELEGPAVADDRKDSSAMSRAVEEVGQIVESLEQVLEQMEEVHELLETAERQKFADEQEIDSLRRALRRIQHPRAHKEGAHGQSG